MPRIIFKCPYVKGGAPGAAAHLGNYVRYMATREGAQRVAAGKTQLPVTKKQRDMVAQLLRDFPLSRGMFEYTDYMAAPTRGNASEFITLALEDNYDQISKKENYVQYIAQRPRAERLGGHALFTGSEDPLALSQVMETVANHPGNVWLPIISLRREDAARLGYDNAENWKKLLTSCAMGRAETMKISWNQFRWYAAFHDEAHHPHIHMVCYSADGSSGYLTKNGIAQIKKDLARQIFRQELHAIYEQQTQRRDDLTQKAGEAMAEFILQMQTGTLENLRMEQLMLHLSGKLKNLSGKKQYGYLKAPLKSVVDEIVDELAKDPRVAKAYELWYTLREEVLRTYREDMPERLPLSQQKEFKRIRNIVIQEAVRLGELSEILQRDDLEDAPELSEVPPVVDESLEEDSPHEMEHPPVVEWSDRYKKARSFLYGSGGHQQDYEQALSLFQAETFAGNALAMYDLGRMYADGLGCEADMEKSREWYAKALAAFHSVEEKNPNRYVEYRIGWMLLHGVGTEKDDAKAREWFERSAKLGNPNAQYTLAKLILDDPTTRVDQIAAAVEWLTKAAEAGQDSAQYTIGTLYRNSNPAKAAAWFQKAAESGNDFAAYALGKLLLNGGDGFPKDIPSAMRWMTRSAEQGNQYAQYTLGKFYLLGKDVTQDKDAAVRWFTLAAAQRNQYAQYFLDHMDDFRDSSVLSCATQLMRHMGNIFQEQTTWNTSRVIAITDRKLRQKIREKKMAMGHKADDHAQEMTM